MFEEAQLRELLKALDAVPSYQSWYGSNPLPLIRAVNLLQPLGKERALAAMREYVRVASDWHDHVEQGIFLVLQTLFDVPADPGYMPPMHVAPPQTPAQAPRDAGVRKGIS